MPDSITRNELPLTDPGIDPQAFDRFVDGLLRDVTASATALGQAEERGAVLEALFNEFEYALVRGSAARSVAHLLPLDPLGEEREERLHQVIERFARRVEAETRLLLAVEPAASARLLDHPVLTTPLPQATIGGGPTLTPGEVNLVFQPVRDLRQVTDLQRALAAIDGLTDVTVSRFADHVCILKANVTGTPPIGIEGRVLAGNGWLPARPGTDGPDPRLFVSQLVGGNT